MMRTAPFLGLALLAIVSRVDAGILTEESDPCGDACEFRLWVTGTRLNRPVECANPDHSVLLKNDNYFDGHKARRLTTVLRVGRARVRPVCVLSLAPCHTAACTTDGDCAAIPLGHCAFHQLASRVQALEMRTRRTSRGSGLEPRRRRQRSGRLAFLTLVPGMFRRPPASALGACRTSTRRCRRFLDRLKAARLAAGLIRVEVARTSGRPQSFVSRCESGERRGDVVNPPPSPSSAGSPLAYLVGAAEPMRDLPFGVTSRSTVRAGEGTPRTSAPESAVQIL